LFKKESSKCFYNIKFGTPEVKVLLLSTYFVVFGIITLVTLSLSIRDSEIIIENTLHFIACQVKGHTSINSCEAERDELESHLQPELRSTVFISLGLLPWSNLLFAIQFRDVKMVLQKIRSVYQQDWSLKIRLSHLLTKSKGT